MPLLAMGVSSASLALQNLWIEKNNKFSNYFEYISGKASHFINKYSSETFWRISDSAKTKS